jgi:hypothetical protein
MRHISRLGLLLLALCAGYATAGAQSCTEEDIGRAIDETGRMLRTVNDEYSPRLTAKLEIVAATRDLNESQVADYARKLMRDPEIKAAEARASELLGRIEAVGDEAAGDAADCVKLEAIEANAAKLRDALTGKYRILFANIDADLAGKSKADTMAAAESIAEAELPTEAETALKNDPAVPKTKEPATAEAAPKTDEPAAAAEPGGEPTLAPLPPEEEIATLPGADWSADANAGQSGILDYEPATPETGPPLSALDEELTTYSADEILSAGKGFFGSVSTGLAGVVAYAFQQAGRPSGYIFGSEGSVAFIAGLRYGKGRLHTKRGGGQTVYWQGPSLGADAGAEGARTMILVYNLKEPLDIYAQFGGVDGSAYVLGGVGITFLTDGDVVLAPIRSGLGLRLGANIGYLKFTPERSIIPF